MRAGGEDAESAVHENQLDIVRLLVSHGADLNITDETGKVILLIEGKVQTLRVDTPVVMNTMVIIFDAVLI